MKKRIRLGKIDKVGRNETCPCGSGKKYKYCCGPRRGKPRIPGHRLGRPA
jgi:hypothetical protein